MDIKKALTILENNQVSTSEIESWVGTFMEDIADNMAGLSALNYSHIEALKYLLGEDIADECGYRNMDEFRKENTPTMAIVAVLSLEKLTTSQINKQLEKCKKLEKFFSSFSI